MASEERVLRRSKRLQEARDRRRVSSTLVSETQIDHPFPLRRSKRLQAKEMRRIKPKPQASSSSGKGSRFSGRSSRSSKEKLTVNLKGKHRLLKYGGITKARNIYDVKHQFLAPAKTMQETSIWVCFSSGTSHPILNVSTAKRLGLVPQICRYEDLQIFVMGQRMTVRAGIVKRFRVAFEAPTVGSIPKVGILVHKQLRLLMKVLVVPNEVALHPQAHLMIDCGTMAKNHLHHQFYPFSCNIRIAPPCGFRRAKLRDAFLYTLPAEFDRNSRKTDVNILLDTSVHHSSVSQTLVRDKLGLQGNTRRLERVSINMGHYHNVKLRNLQMTANEDFDLTLGREVLSRYNCLLRYDRGDIRFSVSNSEFQAEMTKWHVDQHQQ